ncbi:hypothetical protein HaLaN_21286, partial [Haematococcus lacustris]
GGGPLPGQRDGFPRAVGGGGGPGSSSLSQPNSGVLGPGGSDASGSAGLAGWDSFDQAPLDNNQLLINCMEMSKELQSTISAPDVVAQLKSMVTQMQRELGDQEVVVTRVLGSGGSGVVYQGTWRGLTSGRQDPGLHRAAHATHDAAAAARYDRGCHLPHPSPPQHRGHLCVRAPVSASPRQ